MRKSELIAKNTRLDWENDRQAERILDLEAQVGSAMNACSSPTPPRLSAREAVALVAVAMMIDNKAEFLSVGVGPDIETYLWLVGEAHDLRSAVAGLYYPDDIEAEATKLYEGLTH